MELLFPADLKMYLNPGYDANKYTLPPPTPFKHQTGSSKAVPESPGTGNQLKSESKRHLQKVENSHRQHVATLESQRGMEQNYVQLPKSDSINNYEDSGGLQENVPIQYEPFGNQASRVVPLPKYCEKSGRTGDIAQFYSSPKAKYTGKASYHQSLTSHQRIFYSQCRIAVLNSTEGLNCLLHMILIKSIAEFYFMNHTQDKTATLEKYFAKLFI